MLVYGARVSLAVGLLAALSATLLGTWGRRWGRAGRGPAAEFFQTLPRLALIVVALFGAGVGRLIFVIAILWPQAQTARASVPARGPVRGMPRWGGWGRGHRGQRDPPNALAPIVVTGSLDVATAILLEAALGFFGLGDPNRVSWGSMLNQAQPYLRQAWWMAVFPGLAISFVVLSFNVVGDSLMRPSTPLAGGPLRPAGAFRPPLPALAGCRPCWRCVTW